MRRRVSAGTREVLNIRRMDPTRLRDAVRPYILSLKDAGSHERLPSICKQIGLPAPSDEGTKQERIRASFEALSDGDLPRVTEHLLELHPPAPDGAEGGT